MTKKNISIICLVLATIMASCEQRDEQHKIKTAASNEASGNNKDVAKFLNTNANGSVNAPWLSPRNMTPFSFLEIMKKGNNLGAVTMENDFPTNWVGKEDVASLIRLIDSKKKCSCFVNPLSSRIPSGDANVGGYAIAFLTAYKEGRKVDFGLYACPETYKQEVDALLVWWAAQEK